MELNPWVLLIESIRELPWFYGTFALAAGWIAFVKAPQWRAEVDERLRDLLKDKLDRSRSLAHIGCGVAVDTSGNCFALVCGKNGDILRPNQIVDLRFDDSKSRYRLVVETNSMIVPRAAFEAFWESDTLDAIYKALAKMRWSNS